MDILLNMKIENNFIKRIKELNILDLTTINETMTLSSNGKIILKIRTFSIVHKLKPILPVDVLKTIYRSYIPTLTFRNTILVI